MGGSGPGVGVGSMAIVYAINDSPFWATEMDPRRFVPAI